MAARRSARAAIHLDWGRRQLEIPPPAALLPTARVYPGGRSVSGAAAGRLILGDNLPVVQALLPALEGRLALCYVDPPFLSGKRLRARIGRGEDSRRPETWQTAEGFPDAWPDPAAYLDMLYPRLALIHGLLAPSGLLVLHLDWHASGYGRLLLDEIFGPDRLVNEIIWLYHGPSATRSAFKRKHDTLLVYSRSDRYTFNADAVRVPYDPTTWRTFASSARAGFGKTPDLARGKIPEDWWYFPVVARLHRERTGYPTQKPQALLERLIAAFSRPGDVVLDPFCGSGTTPVAASRLGRRWIACDAAPLAIQTTHRRLLLEPGAPPYTIEGSAPDRSVGGLDPHVRLQLDGRRATAELVGVQAPSAGPPCTLEDIDVWEVDWSYDGATFTSLSQAVRGWRKADLALRLDHRYRRSRETTVRVRVADRRGRAGWAETTLRIA